MSEVTDCWHVHKEWSWKGEWCAGIRDHDIMSYAILFMVNTLCKLDMIMIAVI